MKKRILDFDNTICNTTKAMIRSLNPFIKNSFEKVDENSPSYYWSFKDLFKYKVIDNSCKS